MTTSEIPAAGVSKEKVFGTSGAAVPREKAAREATRL
jgi:hypothetical protein